ncbi:MAG: hypothetical protein HZC24_03290, partial [Rhodocyclales bacterium]|nr:hypothetical protein [Rhodocyclales bacterium]
VPARYVTKAGPCQCAQADASNSRLCFVDCGLLLYSLGDTSKNAKVEIFHIGGDPNHPVNRGTLCPKGAALLDFVHCPKHQFARLSAS